MPDIWYQVRKKIGDIRSDLPAGRASGPASTTSSATPTASSTRFTADGFTHRELRDYVEDVRSRLLQVPDVSKIDVLGAQDEQIFVEFSTEKLAGLGIDRSALIAALAGAERRHARPASIQTGDEKLLGARHRRVPVRAATSATSISSSDGRMFRLGDIADGAARLRRPAAADVPRQRQAGDRPGDRHARRRRHPGARQEHRAARWREIKADLPVGIEPMLVADQPVTVEHAIGDFMESLWQAIAIILAVQLRQPRRARRRRGRAGDPADAGGRVRGDGVADIDLQRISLGALIIALGLLVDDAMTTVDAMVRGSSAGDDKDAGGDLRLSVDLAFPMLTGTLVTVAGFVPIGFARVSAGEYTFSLFAVVAHRAARVVARRGPVRAAARRRRC